MIYFTADLHFGHKNILKYENRPFSSVNEMDETLINNWNSLVSNNDDIYILGDLFFTKSDKAEEYLKRLQGNKYLILGNHDRHMKPYLYKYFVKVTEYMTATFNGEYFVLFHYPIFDWDRKFHGSIHLHGHVHSQEDIQLDNKFNVGVDIWNYKPVLLETLLAKKKVKK